MGSSALWHASPPAWAFLSCCSLKARGMEPKLLTLGMPRRS